MQLNIYYNNSDDYNNMNRFYDFLENTDAAYNSFLSTSGVDLFYKENDRLQKIRFDMPDFIPLSVTQVGLRPNSFAPIKTANQSSIITYYEDPTGILPNPRSSTTQ